MIFLLVDDEFPARQELRFVLEQLIPEATFYEASNGEESLAILSKLQPDVVFLDINMPKINGLTTAATIAELPNPPLIVFATAYDQHALKAFELAAIDYVVKPFSKRRLTKTVDKVRQRLGEKKTLAQQKALIKQFLADSPQTQSIEKLWVESENGNRQLMPYDEIAYIEAKEKRVFVKTQYGDTRLTRYTLKALEERLDSHNFCRSHKGFLVNLNAVAELIPWFSGGYQLRLNDTAESTIPVSRRYAQQVKARLG
ncbi:MAG: LytTR family DNA-binding domain-containing protein [Chloroflexota bacterium]